MQICPNCNSTPQDDALFCDHCGVRLDRPAEKKLADAAIDLKMMAGAVSMNLEELVAAPPIDYPIRSDMCPSCGQVNETDARHCSSCGFWLASWEKPLQGFQPPPTKAPRSDQSTGFMPAMEIMAADVTVGKLYSPATKMEFLIRPRLELLIGRSDPGRGIIPDIDLSKEGSASNSVSRKHARLIVHEDQVYLEDLNSTNATYLNKQKLQPDQRYLVRHGDELRIGGVVLIFYTK